MNDMQVVSTMPVKQPEMPVLAVKEPSVSGRMVYIWKQSKAIHMTDRQFLLAEEFLKTRSYPACVEWYKREFGIEIAVRLVKRWLEMPQIADYLKEQFEERGISSGWTKEHWLHVMTKHIQGTERLKQGDLYAMKLIGDHKGWGKDVTVNQQNMVLNFTERA